MNLSAKQVMAVMVGERLPETWQFQVDQSAEYVGARHHNGRDSPQTCKGVPNLFVKYISRCLNKIISIAELIQAEGAACKAFGRKRWGIPTNSQLYGAVRPP